jgi:hypothetical protein
MGSSSPMATSDFSGLMSAGHPPIHGVADPALDLFDGLVRRSYRGRLRRSVESPSWTMRLSDRSSGSTSPRFSRHSCSGALSSLPTMIRASAAADVVAAMV